MWKYGVATRRASSRCLSVPATGLAAWPLRDRGPPRGRRNGEVYRATDTRLDRSVAVKVLTQQVAANPEARERFEREARAVAALSHPHICMLHDVGTQDGTDYLVMELLGGESAAARLERGALPLDEALSIGIAIADALDAAHRQGIVHRDLKPGNVMLTPDGVKLLDFGLAKLAGGGREPGADEAATRTAALTGEGTILGTLHYMSPEQLDGKPADARSDVFAFGATLYEMVTGRRAFEGEGQASIISAVIKDQPPAISEVQPLAPTALGRLIETCLAKEPDGRWQTMRDLKRELRWVAQAGPAETEEVATIAHAAPSRLWFAGSVIRRRDRRCRGRLQLPALLAPDSRHVASRRGKTTAPRCTASRSPVAAAGGSARSGRASGAGPGFPMTPSCWADCAPAYEGCRQAVALRNPSPPWPTGSSVTSIRWPSRVGTRSSSR